MGIPLIPSFRSFVPRKGSFASDVLTLVTGTTIAQALPVVVSPILTRLYTPVDFGILALYMSVASLIAVIATGRYELAVMLPAKDEDAAHIVALSIIIAFCVSLIALGILSTFNGFITRLLNNPHITIWLYIIPVTVFLTGIYQPLNYWSNRKKHYKRLAFCRVAQSTATVGVNLGMGLARGGSSGLILGVVAGQGVATGILGWQVWRKDQGIKDLSKKK